MKTTMDRGSGAVLTEITVGIGERDARSVALERTDKHAYGCRIGQERFVFRSARPDPRAAPRGPGVELRHTNENDDAAPMHLEEVPGCPGLIRSVQFEQPLHLHIERMDERWYWCSIGDHEFSVKRVGRDRGGLELVRA